MANKYVNFNAPSPYASQQADLERRQRLAELMQQQAMQPIETNNTSITPTQGLAKVLQSYLSAKQLANLTQEEKDIETNQGKEVARYLEGRNPQPTVNLPDVAPSFEKGVYTPSQFTPPDSVTTPPLQNMVGDSQRAFIDRSRNLPYLESKLTPEQIRAKDAGENVAPNVKTAPKQTEIEKQVTDLFKAYDENLKISKEEAVDNSKSNLIPITAPEKLFNEVPTITDAQRQAMDLSAVASGNPRLSQLAQYLSQQEAAAKTASRADRKLDVEEERARQTALNQELTNIRLLNSADDLKQYRQDTDKRSREQFNQGRQDKFELAAQLRAYTQDKLSRVPTQVTESVLTHENLIGQINNAIKLIQENPDSIGYAQGLLPLDLLNRKDPKGIPARASIADLVSGVRKDRSGAAVTLSELEVLKPFLPTNKDNAQLAISKLRGLRKNFIDYNSETDRYFNEDQGFRPLPKIDRLLIDLPFGVSEDKWKKFINNGGTIKDYESLKPQQQKEVLK